MRLTTPLIGLYLLAACGVSGDSPPPLTAPFLAAAAFVGTGPTPVEGDLLLIFMSQNSQVFAGGILDDEDLTLSAGSTLGMITDEPMLMSPRVVQVTLGPGVNLTPGVTTVSFSTNNDAVGNEDGIRAIADSPRVLTAGDGDQPTVDTLTLSSVDGELNGTGFAGGTLQVPRNGFTINVEYSDVTSAIDGAATVITADVEIQTASGAVKPGTSLTPQLMATVGPDDASFVVPSTVTFPDGAVELSVQAVDTSGMVSNATSFDLRVRNLDDSVRPFETNVNSAQMWFLDTSRDIESYTQVVDPTVPVRVNAGANGTPDVEDLWEIVGLFGGDTSANDTVRTQLQAGILMQLTSLHPGINVSFSFQPLGTFPPSTTVPYNSFSFSQMCIAGSEDTSGASGILGVALLDPHNANQDNNCLTNFAGSQRLGVFVHTLVNTGIAGAPTSLFRMTYDPFTPGFGGIPIGDAADGMDPGRLAGSVVDARAAEITLAIDRMARTVAVITAHECGHSMGLVRDGKMPDGLYGNDPAFFGSTPNHILNSSFPPGSQNVMSPALAFDTMLSSSTAFNTLNLAYLLEIVIYN